MGKKLDLTKYKRMARILEVLMKIFFGVGIFAAIAAATAGVIFIFIPDTASIFNPANNGSFNLSLDGIMSFKINSLTVGSAVIKTLMIRIMFMASAVSLVLTPIFKQLSLILGTIRNDKPFVPENAKRLTIIGAVIMAGSFIIRLAEFFVAVSVVYKLKLDNVNISLSPDSNMFLMGFMVLILAGVFKYGSYLQRQYDSTV